MPIKPRFVVPNLFTSLNFLLGVAAILWATGAFPSLKDPYYPFFISANLVILCALLDKLDGFAARLMNASSEFGAQLDSLADLIAFGLAPAFGVFYAYRTFANSWYESHTVILLVAMGVYVLAAAIRLAKYNAMDSDSYPDYFVGLPSTFSGAINAVLLILLGKYGFWENPGQWIHLPIAVMVGTGILMISPLFMPKLKRRKSKLINFLQIINIVATYICGFAMIFPEYLLFGVSAYFILGFSYGIIKRDDILAEAEKISADKATA